MFPGPGMLGSPRSQAVELSRLALQPSSLHVHRGACRLGPPPSPVPLARPLCLQHRLPGKMDCGKCSEPRGLSLLPSQLVPRPTEGRGGLPELPATR